VSSYAASPGRTRSPTQPPLTFAGQATTAPNTPYVDDATTWAVRSALYADLLARPDDRPTWLYLSRFG
jgi:hypothetical protein